MVSTGRGESRSHLGIREPARQCRITAVPQLGGEIAPGLFHHQLHQRAGVEVDQRHQLAPLLADQLGYRSTRARTRPILHRRPARLDWPGDDPVVGEAFNRRPSVQSDEPRHRQAPLSDDDLLTTVGVGEPVTEMRSKLGHRNVHTEVYRSAHRVICTHAHPIDMIRSACRGASIERRSVALLGVCLAAGTCEAWADGGVEAAALMLMLGPTGRWGSAGD